MMRNTLDRRTVLKTMAVGATSAALAGCSSTSGGNGSNGGGGNSRDDSVDYDGWFENVSNFDGTVDETDASEVTVEVGAEGNNGNYAFAPAAVKVSSGTEVVWEWTGEGGSHNVIADGGEFESELTGEEGYTFSHTFDSSGTYKYVCSPHETMGMKGAVVVE